MHLRHWLPLAFFVTGAATAVGAWAQAAAAPNRQTLPSVTISGTANPDPVEKSYRKMIRGIELFERERARAPGAELRFRLYPRDRGTDMSRITLDVVGDTVEFPVQLEPDSTFTLPRDPKALAENAQVIPNRRARSMTWRTDIRTPGLPPNVRRLGDLRLECRVGMEAGLVSDTPNFMNLIVSALLDTPAYCEREDPRYLFFADKPIFGVTLVDGTRRHTLPVAKMYGGATNNPKLDEELPFCDCAALIDHTYFLPLDDRSWPDDTRVEFEYIEDAP